MPICNVRAEIFSCKACTKAFSFFNVALGYRMTTRFLIFVFVNGNRAADCPDRSGHEQVPLSQLAEVEYVLTQRYVYRQAVSCPDIGQYHRNLTSDFC